MDNITYKIRNRDEISEQLVYIKVLTSEAKELENLLVNKRRKWYTWARPPQDNGRCVRREG